MEGIASLFPVIVWFVPHLWKKKTFSLLGGLDAVVESPFLRHTWVFLGSLSLFFFFGCATCLAASQFPNQRLNLVHGSENPES